MNILDIVKNYLPGNLAAQLSGSTGENETGITQVITAAIPVILSSLINKSTKDPGSVWDMVKNAANSGVLSNLSGQAGRNTAATPGGFNIWSTLHDLFGDKLDNIIDMLSGFGGVKTTTAEQALGATSAATLGAVGRYASDKNMDAPALAAFLSSQKGIINSLVPAGFDFSSIAPWLGIGGMNTAAVPPVSSFTTPPAAEPVYPAAVTPRKGGNNWLVPLVILAALAGLIWWLSKGGCNKSTTVSNTNIDTAMTTIGTADTGTIAPAAPAATAARQDVMLTLPDGVTINAYKGGIEDQLISFIQSDEYKNAADDEALKNRWFNFDNLNFEFGTSKITDSSKVQLDNIAAILKAFKDVHIKLGSYTDKKGDDMANLKLSQERADAVKAALQKTGVGAQLKGAEGYGEKFATVAETETDDARAVDRKVAVRLAK